MLKSIFICIFLFTNNLHAKECDDCIVFKSCPKAFELAQSRNNPEKFKNSFCGYDSSGNRKLPKVCCSEFSTDDRLGEQSISSNLENHPNARLLPNSCGDINGKRIIGGKIASLYEFPWMALISHDTRLGLRFQCGGSVINSRYILTAAHCVDNHVIAGVRIGEYDIRYPTDCQGVGDQYTCESHFQDMAVEKKIVHEDYKGLPYVINDIALLRLKKHINFSYKNAGPICLPITSTLRNEYIGGKKGTVAGWGVTENDQESSILLKVDIPILTSSQCRSTYNRSSLNGEDRTEKQLCAGELNKDSCNGDSGGPLMLESIYDGAYRIVQYGIVSHGPKQCGSNYPGIYTDVTKFMDWILNKIEE